MNLPFALRIDGLTRRYRTGGWRLGLAPPALDAVSLTVAPGSLLAVVGPAGAGKSTLLRLLAGADRPTAGSFDHPGIEPCQIGALLQGDSLSTRHTLAENVAMPLRRLRPALDRATAARLASNALDLLHVSAHAKTLPQNAGASVCQRALVARALVAEPRLLLLDEPLAHQEETERAALAATLRQLHELLGTTTILATRSAAAALPLADAMAVLHEGRLVEAGSPQTLYEAPASARTAALLGPVNLLPGKILAVEDDIADISLDCGPTVQARMAGPSWPRRLPTWAAMRSMPCSLPCASPAPPRGCTRSSAAGQR
jgi:ABC-type Fe3+/spermidine/putrescine transport system ATPase subunit